MMKFTHTTTTLPSGQKRVLALPAWDTFDLATVIPELELLFARGRKLADDIATIPEPTFRDIVTPFEELDAAIGSVAGPVRHLKATMLKSYPGIQEIEKQVADLGTNYGTDLAFHEGLYGAYKRLCDGARFATLNKNEQYLIRRTVKDFELAGVSLSPEKKLLLKQLNEEGTGLATKFSNNDQDATDAWSLVLPDASRLFGVPEDDLLRMQNAQKEKGKEGYLITLQQPYAVAIMTYAEDRALRKEIAGAWVTVASEFSSPDGKWDNAPVSKAIVLNAHKSAQCLGYATYAEVSLAKKMALSVGVSGVRTFLLDLANLARPKAIAEFEAMSKFAKENLPKELRIDSLEAWDMAFVEERMRKELYDIDSELIRQYFPFTKVMEGLSYTLKKLFDLTLVLRTDVVAWHSEVRFYEVHDAEGVLRGAFYADMYAREGKRSGAWMDVLLASRETKEGMIVPVAYLNCNASRSADGGDAYLTHDQVETLFHEFGHTLHHVAGGSSLHDLSMEHVEWDTVELPSQFMENWTWEESALALMTAKKGTGEPIPKELVSRMLAVRNFNTGLATLKQIVFGLYDWELYSRDDVNTPVDPLALWWKMFKEIDVRPLHPNNRFPNAFTHIFSGGYSAGYFSYMWALGLSADAFSVFKEAGDIFSRTVGMSYLDSIIVPGSSRPMAESFEEFRGRKLNPRALAMHLGLIEH